MPVCKVNCKEKNSNLSTGCFMTVREIDSFLEIDGSIDNLLPHLTNQSYKKGFSLVW